MSAPIKPRYLDGNDSKNTIMVVTVSAVLLLIVIGILFYVTSVAGPGPVYANANNGHAAHNGVNANGVNANRANGTNNANGADERDPDALHQGFAAEYLRFILQRARAAAGRHRAPDNEGQNADQPQNAGNHHQNANGHGQNSGAQGHDSGAQGRNGGTDAATAA
ncbi:hypothetical protein ACHAPT_010691 [Fusarium lateritium]